MPLTNAQLSSYLQVLRDQFTRAVATQEEDWARTSAWADSIKDSIHSGNISYANTFLFPKTPKKVTNPANVPTLKAERLCSVAEDEDDPSETQVTSTANISCSPGSEPRRTLRTRRIIKVEVEELENNGDEDNYNQSFKIPAVPSKKVGRKESTRSSKRLQKTDENLKLSVSETPQNVSRAESGRSLKHLRNNTASKEDIFNETSETPQTAKKVSSSLKGAKNFNQSTGDGGIYVQALSTSKESIGANSTYITETASKESIGANSTYVTEPAPKASIGVNSTYVTEPASKESIGANSTYVTEPASKESIGANSTYVLGQTMSKESIGANHTYVLERSNSKASIGANSTSVFSTPEGKEVISQKPEKSSSLEISQGIATTNASDLLTQASVVNSLSKNTTGNAKAKATIKAARKSLTRAKMIAVSKACAIECNPGKIWCKQPHDQVSQCSKPVLFGHYRSVSQSESSPAPTLWGTTPGKSTQTLKPNVFYSATKGTRLGTGKNVALINRTPSKNEDRLQALVAKTLKIGGMKPSNEKKSTKEKQDRALAVKSQHELTSLEAKRSKELEKQRRKEEAGQLKNKKLNGKVTQESSFKDNFIQKVANQGFSHLALATSSGLQDIALQPSTSKMQKQVLQANKVNHVYEVGCYDMTLDPEDRPPLPSKDEDNYGLDDVHSSDSSDDESKPKKVVPQWAQAAVRLQNLLDQYFISHAQVSRFFESKKTTPDLTKLFTSIDKRILSRRSSAVWISPDHKKAQSGKPWRYP